MSLGDPILINLSGSTFLLTAETGVIIQSSDRAIDAKWKEVWNQATGTTVGYVVYDSVAAADFSAIVSGTTGLAIAAPGVVLSLANDLGIGTNKNGVSAGGTYTKSVRVSHGSEDLRMISGNTVQRQGIT